jgi:hypothetical protein
MHFSAFHLREHDMDFRFLLSALLIGGHVLLCGAASVGGTSVEPPLSPDGEAVMHDERTASACLARAGELGTKLDQTPDTAGYFQWTLGTPLVTVSETWGVVCRIDFQMAGKDFSPYVNRLVLYAAAQKTKVMIAIGQDIAPLQTDTASLSQ